MFDIFNPVLNGNHFLRRFLVIYFFCFAEALGLNAQKQYSRFDHLTTENGLSSNRIWCIYRDSKDYLWMSTDVGLDKFDSYQVKKYRYNEKQPGSISSDNTLVIYEDLEKKLWFGTNNGLNLYNRAKDSFEIFKNNPIDSNSINGNYINSIIEDKKGNIWVVTDGNCLNQWISKTKSFIRYKFENKKYSLYPRPSRMIANDSKGDLWIVPLSRGIIRFEPATGKFTEYDDQSIDFGFNCFKSLYIDNQDKIWITSDGSGFFSYYPRTGKFQQFGSKGDGKGTNKSNILDILAEDDRYIILAVDQGGINRFDKVSGTFEYIMSDNENDDGLNNNGIWCFYKDRQGILWIGTSGGGINYYNPKKDKFKLFRHTNNTQSISYSFTGCFYEDHEGLIWIGTDGGGVNVLDPETGKITLFKNNPADPYSLSGNVIRSIAEDKDNDIWIGTWDAGLNMYNRKTGKFTHFMPEKNNPSSISGRTIWNLFIDQNNILWLGEYTVGIDLFDKKKGVVRRIRTDTDNPESISSSVCWLFYEDSEKNIWICTENGLAHYNFKTNLFKIFKFPDNSIVAFSRDKDGNLWVGSRTKGIFFCKPDGTIINTFDITNGLPNNNIQAIVEDDNGNIWISTNGGISLFDRKTKKFRNYFKEDGLQSDQFFQQSFLKTRGGEIYFGGYNGFNSFHPDSLKDNDFIPPVYITDFQIFNKPVPVGVPGAQFPIHISEAKEIKLNWDQSVLSFSFVAINYTYPEKNQYAYIMEGFEQNWNYINSSRRYVTYTNLDPGKYTFKVKASNNDGIWNENGASLNIIILPPWWKTLLFKIIIISSLIFLIVFIFLNRVRRLSNQKSMLEKLVANKTTELQLKNNTLVKQAEELNKSNYLLEERQQQIEKQREELLSQKEALVEMYNELNELNASR